MLGKLRLKPSLLLEVAFMLGAWLGAWLIFHATLWVIIVVIFGAYALVFVYEKWLDGLARRERSEQRRARREAAAQYLGPDPSAPSLPPSNSSVSEVRRAEAPVTVRPILEQLVAELNEREAELPPEVIAAEALRAREQAERERAEHEQAERDRAERDRAERERGERERAARERAEREARERAEEEKPPEPEPEEPEPEPEPERRSLLTEFATSPGETRHTHAVGGWNVWQLERMLAANTRPDAERDYERSLLLVYLREFADSDGQLPPEFDGLVNESFGDLVRGPAGP
ncbi:MAG: hypothetical protein ABSB96_07410 [Gaiellaceae bacterium]